MKQLICREIGVDCDVAFRGKTEEDIMRQAAEHAAREHNLPTIPQNIAQKCLAAIKDVPDDATVSAGAETKDAA